MAGREVAHRPVLTDLQEAFPLLGRLSAVRSPPTVSGPRNNLLNGRLRQSHDRGNGADAVAFTAKP